MDFDLSDVEPKPSNWLELNLRYEGRGSAEFTSPKGSVVGPFIATFDEHGSILIETQYELISSADPDYEGNDLVFLSGAKVQKTDKVKSWGIGSFENPCRELSISTSTGVFSSTGKPYLAGFHLGETAQLRFGVREGKFETKNTTPAKYFVMPLFNFVAELGNRLFGDHPLRIYPTPTVPESVPEKYRVVANMKAHEKNSVIGFVVEQNLYFIERLPDYEERLSSLKTGMQRRVTAVLVGDLGHRQASSMAEFRSWFPFEMLSALGFVSGTEVGRLWIEIRDEKGGLIRRLHVRPQLPTFWEGDELMRRYDKMGGNPAMGEFLTGYLKQPPEKRSYLEVSMNHARLGSLGSHLRLYDILDHLIRALECLCREHGLVQRNLAAGLSSENKETVMGIVAEATRKFQELATNLKVSGPMDEHRILATIMSRTDNVHTTEKKFGLSVVALLQRFGFHDADIIDKFLAANPRPDTLPDWATVITNYRNATIHEGYMDFKKKHDAKDVVRVCAHLKDAITRTILRECGYTGTYTSVLCPSYGPQPLDWIQPDTDASKLAF